MAVSRRVSIVLRGCVVAAVALGSTATAASGVGPAAARPVAAPPVVNASVTAAPAIRSLSISVHGGVVRMPSRLLAGTYYVHVSTPDVSNGIQVVRPPRGLTVAKFQALYAAWDKAMNGGVTDPRIAHQRWRTSATFVGGATVVPRATGWDLSTPSGLGVFAITLTPGRYWFYASNDSGRPYNAARPRSAEPIYEVTVVGTASRATVPVVGVVRFGQYGVVPSGSLPRTLPRQGFLLAIGAPTILSTLQFHRLLPGVTDAQLHDGTTCLADNVPAAQQCFLKPGVTTVGGAVSGGSSTLWYYQLPPGDYAVGQGSGDYLNNYSYNTGDSRAMSRVTIR